MLSLEGLVPGIVDAHAHFFNPRITPWSLQRLGPVSRPLVRALPGPVLRLASGLTGHSLDIVADSGVLNSRFEMRDYMKSLSGLRTVAGVPVAAVLPVDAQWRRRLDPDEVSDGVRSDVAYLTQLPYGVDDAPRLGGLVVAGDPRVPGLGIRSATDDDERGCIKGVRVRWGRHPDPLVYDWHTEAGALSSPSFRRAFAGIAERGLIFESLCYSHELGTVDSLAREFPDTTIVVEHMGMPAGVFGPIGTSTGATAAARADILSLWRERMSMLAVRPNVMVKISGIASPLLGYGRERSGNIGSQHILADMIGPLVLHVVDRFGPDRVIWGSNAPMDSPNATVAMAAGALIDVLADRGDYLLANFFARNAQRVYRISDAETAPTESADTES
ncbi:MAG: amidohydrolase family protein [Gordonia sp. (in: high G+C Gram-positive bacteria)]